MKTEHMLGLGFVGIVVVALMSRMVQGTPQGAEDPQPIPITRHEEGIQVQHDVLPIPDLLQSISDFFTVKSGVSTLSPIQIGAVTPWKDTMDFWGGVVGREIPIGATPTLIVDGRVVYASRGGRDIHLEPGTEYILGYTV